MLVNLVSEYLTKKSVRDAYGRRPLEVLRRFGVTEAQILALARKDLADVVADELRALATRRDRDLVPFAWGVVAMKVKDFEPTSAPAGMFELIIRGRRFSEETVAAVMEGPLSTSNLIDAEQTTYVSDKELRARFKLGKGKYRVAVYQRRKGVYYGSWEDSTPLTVEKAGLK